MVLVRNPDASEFGKIYFHDVGDYLDQKEKLSIVKAFRSIGGITDAQGWRTIEPNAEFDWVDQGDRSYQEHLSIGSGTKVDEPTIFNTASLGLNTNRDAWAFNSSSTNLAKNMKTLIETYNAEVERDVDYKSVNNDPKEIKWSSSLEAQFNRRMKGTFAHEHIVRSTYRPFQSQWVYYERMFVHRMAKMPQLFGQGNLENLVIDVSGVGSRNFSLIMFKGLVSLDTIEKGQCFPLKLYAPSNADDGLFSTGATGYTKRDGISDAGLRHFQDAYAGEQINKEDLFYYIYGLLHSPDYRERFKNNLSKELPRIPAVKTAADFWAFSKAGRLLGDLHVNYETVEPYPVVIKEGDLRLADIPDPEAFYRVEKMKYGGKGKDKDKTTVHYNPRITMTGIPLEAYDYVVNGKPALDWVVERQCVKTDKASGIVNDANRYANETVGNPAYPLELFQRVITVSLETMKIVNGLPKLDID